MKAGDFSALAKDYINRPGYSEFILKLIAQWAGAYSSSDFRVADVGAGTGKLTENLLEIGLNCVAVEPNDAMRSEGQRLFPKNVSWRKGSGENTGLENSSQNWVLMGSSFHWVEFEEGLKEFHRILKPGGVFTAVWNPRDLERSELHTRIEQRVYEICPQIKRVSSGSGEFTKTLLNRLPSTGLFKDAFFIEACNEVVMTKERYLGAWRSVNDIQAQAGEDGFKRILAAIEREIADCDEITVPYKTRAWSARRI